MFDVPLTTPLGAASAVRSDPTAEYVVAGAGPGLSDQAGLLRAEVYDEVIRQYGRRIYRLMDKDDACSAAMFLLKAGAIAEGVQLAPAVTSPEGVEVTDPEMKRRVSVSADVNAFCGRVMAAFGDQAHATLWELLDGLPFGCNLAEPVYDLAEDGEDRGKLVPRRWQCKPRWAWAFVVSPVLEVIAIRVWTTAGWVDVEPEHFTVLTWQGKNGDPRGTSVYEPAYPWWNLKVGIYPDYGEFLKKFASASIVIEAGPTQEARNIEVPGGRPVVVTPQQQNAAAGREFKNHSVLALPAGATANVMYSQGTGEAFDRGFDRADRAIFRSIILATRPMQEAKHGSKADTESGLDLFSTGVAQVRKALGSLFRTQFLRTLVRLNYGDQVARDFTPLVSFGVTDALHPDLMTAFATAWERGIFEPPQLPWIWGKIGAPVPEGWSPEERQQPGETAPAVQVAVNPQGGPGDAPGAAQEPQDAPQGKDAKDDTAE